MMNPVKAVFRIDKTFWKSFKEACEINQSDASTVLRSSVYAYLELHKDAKGRKIRCLDFKEPADWKDCPAVSSGREKKESRAG